MTDTERHETVLHWLKSYAAGDYPDATAAEAALYLASLDRPENDITAYFSRLDDICEDLERAIADTSTLEGTPPRVMDLAIALQNVIPGYHGFQGDEENYDDTENANLMCVIDRKRGLPVALALLYLHAAARCGLDMTGIDFPGHFLLRLEANGERVLLDPFHNGIVLGAAELRELLKAFQGLDAELQPEHYREATDRTILLRLQNNIKVRALRSGDLAYATTILERCLIIAPDEPGLWHQAGTLHARLNNDEKALACFEQFLKLNHDPRHHQRIKTLAAELRDRIAGILPGKVETVDETPDDTVIPFHPVKNTGASDLDNTPHGTSSPASPPHDDSSPA
ncbi:SirB1 family protein [Thalassospira sp. TSL5-1]|uniref:SirB1 family protein n=1 Tax=Thalassospira sp. TSL5-1 TaxID=1544451 RepID=UPI0009F9DEC0|nr:transglutaminase-like domain-containing protein [Thalassospira sp. TSL5-1]